MTDALRPFRFGVQVATAKSRAEWIGLARRAEANGFSVLTMPDHFDDQLAPTVALMAAADATTTLRVGALVWDNDYRHPVVLAKEIATLDLLTDGRLEIGLGAGWLARDYEKSGIAYDPPKVRIDRFVEGLAVIKGALGDGPFSFHGEHYRISDYDATPKPVQRPLPPILIGGGGARVLTIAAREADIVGINSTMAAGVIGPEAVATMTAAAVDGKIDVVRAAAGARLGQIDLSVRVFLTEVTNSRAVAMQQMADSLGVTRDDVEQSPFALVGSTAQIVDDLRARRERWGFSHIVVGASELDSMAPVVAELSGT